MEKRENWSNKTVFIMAAIGSAVGLGNLWRFPYIAYKNGGGAFLIPYFIALLTTGIPLMILEFGVGYLNKNAAPQAFRKIKSKFEWIGWWSILISSVITVYYMVVMAWCCVYLVDSFNVSWKNNEAKHFYKKVLNLAPTENTGFLISKTNKIKFKFSAINQTEYLDKNLLKIKIDSEPDYLKIKFDKLSIELNGENIKFDINDLNFQLNKKEQVIHINNELKKFIEDKGLINPYSQLFSYNWKLVLGLLFSWLLVYFIVCDGVEKVGKIVSWTVPLPLILVLIILIKGLLQNGAFLGIKHYLNPNFEVLTDSKVWLAAYSQIFYSLSIGFGILIAYASYLPKKQAEISNSAFITSFANCFTSYFVGFAVFSIIGYLSLKNGTDISHTVKSGPGLAFVVFPAALSKLPGAPFFSVLFFITLLSLGIDSAFSIVEAIISAIDDKFDNKVSRKKITLFVCLIGFILGFIFISRSGLYWLDIVDHWMNNYGLAVVGVFECIVIGYLVDIKLFRKKINEHSDFSLNGIWDFCIKYVTPIILCYLIGSSIISEVTNPYSGYPRNILNIGGWAVILTTIIIALFLMENKNKWLYKIIIIFFTLVIALIAMNKQELGMFIFGTAFLLGGLIFFIKISYKKSKL